MVCNEYDLEPQLIFLQILSEMRLIIDKTTVHDRFTNKYDLL